MLSYWDFFQFVSFVMLSFLDFLIRGITFIKLIFEADFCHKNTFTPLRLIQVLFFNSNFYFSGCQIPTLSHLEHKKFNQFFVLLYCTSMLISIVSNLFLFFFPSTYKHFRYSYSSFFGIFECIAVCLFLMIAFILTNQCAENLCLSYSFLVIKPI